MFSPIRIGPIEVANRFYLPPHGTPLHVGGAPSDDFAHYYAERASGGVGLAIHSLPISPRQIGRAAPLREDAIPSFKVVADMMHERGAKIFGQLHHSWVNRSWQWEPQSPHAPMLSASNVKRFDSYDVTHEMTIPEIEAMVERVRQCARNLSVAGYDGIEVHVTHGMLAEHFVSPYFNHRTDRYGGSTENRMRLVIEFLQAARDGAGPGLAVGMRFNCDEMMPGGLAQEDAREIVGKIAAMGLIDFVDLDIAIEPNQFPFGMPSYFLDKFTYESFVAGVRTAARKIVVLSALGRVTSVADAEEALARGACDLVGAARGLIAEPDLVKNAREGREHESRQCTSCNLCLNSAATGAFGCAINPATAHERRWGRASYTHPAQVGTVVVVGAGPAGMEAARVAAKRGHSVVLFERTDRIGGQLTAWAALPGRGIWETTPAWYRRQLAALGVDVRLNVQASAERILAERPFAVIVATGSTYARTGESGFMAGAIPGSDQDFVHTPEEIIDGLRPDGRILVLDDENLNTGPGVAELLALSGANVELMTPWLQPVQHLIGTHEFAFIIPRLKKLGVTLTTQTYVREIAPGTVTTFDVFTNEERQQPVDHVVLVTMRTPVGVDLAASLAGRVPHLYVVGDALAPRGLTEATYEAHFFARFIGEPDAPKDFNDAYWRAIPADAYPRPASAAAAAKRQPVLA